MRWNGSLLHKLQHLACGPRDIFGRLVREAGVQGEGVRDVVVAGAGEGDEEDGRGEAGVECAEME